MKKLCAIMAVLLLASCAGMGVRDVEMTAADQKLTALTDRNQAPIAAGKLYYVEDSTSYRIDVEDFYAYLATYTGVTTGGSLAPMANTAANFAANFTGAYLYGGTYRVITTAGTLALPDPAVGMNFSIILGVAGNTTIASLATGTADTIILNGLAAAQDEDIIADAIGDTCVFQYYAANTWLATCNGFAEVTPP